MPRKQKTTSTTSFGSPGRIGHNASTFYCTRLHAQKTQCETQPYVENSLTPGLMDTILHATCEQMSEPPYRLIQLYTFTGEIVLDPFMGSGQTALAALKSGRHFVGYEINAEYGALAQQRIQESKDGRV